MAARRSSVAGIVRRVDAGRRAPAMAILVGSVSGRVAIQRRTACERGRAHRRVTI
jgi:hypothetical protein